MVRSLSVLSSIIHCTKCNQTLSVFVILIEQFAGETLIKFNMIAARNKFGNSNWDRLGASKPLQVRLFCSVRLLWMTQYHSSLFVSKDFFGSKLIEYMVCIFDIRGSSAISENVYFE